MRFVTIFPAFLPLPKNNTIALIIVCITILTRILNASITIVLKKYSSYYDIRDSEIAKDHHTDRFKYILINILSKVDEVTSKMFSRRTVKCYESKNSLKLSIVFFKAILKL